MRTWLTILLLAIGCGDDSASTDGGGTSVTDGGTTLPNGTSSSGSSSDGSTTTDGDASTTVSPGTPCPLVGMFRECTVDGTPGLAYCDDLDGELAFGPCLTESPECELLDPSTCMDVDGEFVIVDCELVDGVPTWVPDGRCDVGTGG